jgi:hypothetical protein
VAVFWVAVPRNVSKVLSASEKSINFYQATRRKIPNDSYILNGRPENLKYRLIENLFNQLLFKIFSY